MAISNIRVKVNKKYFGIYRDLTSDTNLHSRMFEMHGDIFTLCTTLGFRLGNYKQMETKGEALFWSHNLTSEAELTIKSIAISNQSNEYTILENDNSVILIAENYADIGMEILIQRVLYPFIMEESGGFFLKFTNEDCLEKEILDFIYNEYVKTPIEL